MSMEIGPDPLDQLRAADPVRADDVPTASLARVSARMQEHIMSDLRRDPTILRPTRGPLAVAGGLALTGALALAVVFGGGFGAQSPGPIAANPTPSQNPAAGGGLASCLVYDPANLPTFDVVFDGTVSAIDGDQVTFDVATGWKGAGDSITLTAPQVDIALVGPMPEFKVGARYLVSAAGLADPAVGIPNTATVADALALAPDGTPAVVICGPDGKPQGVLNPGAAAAVPPQVHSTTPVTAVAHPLAAGAYVPEWSKGQELIQYLAKLDGGEYAVVDHNGYVTGLLRQEAVVTAITGKEARRSGRA